MAEPQDVHRVEAVDRALQLLVALADAGPAGAPLAELAKQTQMNKSTAHRALATLSLRGFAIQDGEGAAYQLGPAAFGLGDRSYGPKNLAQALHPALVALSRVSEELVHLGVLAGDYVLYVDKVEPDRAIRVWSAIGQQVPIASTAMGRALLAARDVPADVLASYLNSLPAGHPVSRDRLLTSVNLARRRGYALERGENEPEVACIGTAILRAGTPVAALSITTLAARMTGQRERVLSRLIASEVPPRLPYGLSLPLALTEE